MSNRAWMPLHIDDYLADTGHLTGAEHGAYMLLIMHYWQNGNLPENERLIARIARMDAAQWEESREILAMLFGPNWTHKRIDAELAKADEIIEKRRSAANARHKRSAKSADAVQVQSKCTDTGALPLTDNHSYTADARADDVSARMSELCAALGVTDETKTPGLLVLSEPIRWVAAGCDIDLDIIPALRSIAARGRTVKSWAYCSDAVFEARDRRLAPAPDVQSRPGTSPPLPRKPRNAGEAARLELIRRGEYPDATSYLTGPENQSDRNTGFAGTDIARRIALASGG